LKELKYENLLEVTRKKINKNNKRVICGEVYKKPGME